MGEVAESFDYGLNAAAADFDGINKYIRITDIDDDNRTFKTESLTSPDCDLSLADNYKLKNGDILFARTGASVGRSYLYRDIDGLVYFAGFLIRARINQNFNAEFVFQNTLTNSYLNFIKITSQRSGQPGVNAQEYESYLLHTPQINEQQKLGEFFRTLDNTITLYKRKLDGLKQLKKAYLQQMFPQEGETVPRVRFAGFTGDWREAKLGEIGTVQMNKRIFKEQTTRTGDVPFYKIGTFGKQPDAFISRELFKEYKLNYPYPEKGDLLISASGSIGKIVEYTGKDEYFQDSNIVWLQHEGRLENSFLKQFYAMVQWSEVEGTTIKRLYNKNILETEIAYPEKKEQTAIGNFFRNLDEQIATQQTKLDNIKKLKSTYLQKMFV